jgi:hypothetical protein
MLNTLVQTETDREKLRQVNKKAMEVDSRLKKNFLLDEDES